MSVGFFKITAVAVNVERFQFIAERKDGAVLFAIFFPVKVCVANIPASAEHRVIQTVDHFSELFAVFQIIFLLVMTDIFKQYANACCFHIRNQRTVKSSICFPEFFTGSVRNLARVNHNVRDANDLTKFKRTAENGQIIRLGVKGIYDRRVRLGSRHTEFGKIFAQFFCVKLFVILNVIHFNIVIQMGKAAIAEGFQNSSLLFVCVHIMIQNDRRYGKFHSKYQSFLTDKNTCRFPRIFFLRLKYL